MIYGPGDRNRPFTQVNSLGLTRREYCQIGPDPTQAKVSTSPAVSVQAPTGPGNPADRDRATAVRPAVHLAADPLERPPGAGSFPCPDR